MLDEHEHHHPHEDSDHDHIAEEDERTESQSDRTLQEENSQDDRQQGQKDVEKAEKAEKRPVRQRAKSSSGKPQDPETRQWKDDVSRGFARNDFQMELPRQHFPTKSSTRLTYA